MGSCSCRYSKYSGMSTKIQVIRAAMQPRVHPGVRSEINTTSNINSKHQHSTHHHQLGTITKPVKVYKNWDQHLDTITKAVKVYTKWDIPVKVPVNNSALQKPKIFDPILQSTHRSTFFLFRNGAYTYSFALGIFALASGR